MSRRAGPTLGDVGEHAWIDRLSPMLTRQAALGRVIVGPGDDAAVLRPGTKPIVVTTDALVDGVHFRRAAVDPRALGRRAYRAAASDVGAMGGRPIAAVLALTAPRTMDATALGRVTAGAATEASGDRDRNVASSPSNLVFVLSSSLTCCRSVASVASSSPTREAPVSSWPANMASTATPR